MSYDVAVWEGERPPTDAEAGVVFTALYEQYLESEAADQPPSSRIRSYVEALLARWPDIDTDDDSPWSTAPLMNEASGPVIYIPMGYSRAAEVSAFCAQVALEHGLVFFDVSSDRLRP